MAIVDYFLKLEGIDGESEDKTHSKEIHIESWSFGEQQSGTMAHGGGGGAGKVQMHDFHFVMKTNAASPKLFLACASGEHIKKAVLTCRKAGKDQQEYLKWTFTELLVSSYQTGGSGSSDVLPLDQISLNFAQVEVAYKAQKSDGTLAGELKSGWNLKQNAKV
jgi:type VI secretion system secreted protein Hcp